MEKDLMALRKGVIYGRRTFGNIIKYIKMTASSNFGNMFSMLGASAIKLEPLPLSYFPWLIGILTGYCLLIQLVKNWFIKKFNQWL